MRVLDHKEGPLDGSLYATVTKNSAISQQKQAMTTALGSMHQSPQQHPASMASSTLDSMASTHLSQNSLYDQSQLDDILNELLNESKKLNTSVASSDSSSLQLSPGRGYGSITTNAGNSRTVVSWQTSNAGPVKAGTVTKHTVAQPSPNSRTESVYTVHREEYNSTNGNAPVPPKRSTVPRLPPNAFSYTGFDSKDGESSVKSSRHETITSTRHESLNSTPINVTPIPPQRSSSARHFSPSAYERIASPTFSTNARSSPGPSRLPYRIDYEINPDSDTSHGYESDSGLSNKSWLQQQQMKLMAKREGRHDWVGQHTVQEQQLVNELKAAQASLKRRTASESAEPSVFEQRVTQNHSFQVESSNVPRKRSVSPVRHSRPLTKTIPLQRSQSESGYEQYRSEKSYYVSGVERPAFTTHQTKYTFSISPPKTSGISTQQETVTAKPPPSPAFGRSAPTSPLLAQKAYNFENRQVFKESSESTEYKFENQQRAYSQQRRPQDDGVVEEEIVTLQPVGLYNLEYEDKQRTTAAPPPQPEEDDYVEEEVVTLQPIGTGLQSLEPEIEGVVTHGRPPTPSFPTTVSNDSFSPKTPYDNKSLSPNLRQQHSPQVQMSSLSRNGLTNKPQSREGSYDRFEVERKLEAQMIDMSPKQASQEQYANQQYNVQRSVSNQMSSNQQSPKRDAYGNQQYSMQRTTSSQMSTNQASPNQPGQEQYLNQQYNMQQRSAPNQMSSNEAHKIESSAFNRSGQEQFVAQQFNMQQRAAPNQMSSQETHKFDASPGFNRQGQEQYLNQQINMNQRMGGNQMSHGDQMQRMDVSPGQQRQMDSQQQYSVQRSMVTSSEQMQRATPVNVPQPQPQQAQVIANNSMDSSHTQQMNRNMSANESYTMENGHMHQLSVDTSSQNYPGGYFPASPSVNSEGSQQFSPSIGGSTFSRSTLNTTAMTGQSSPATSTYHGQSHRGSFSSLADSIDVIHHTPRFVRDTSKMWYKPHISREEAITLLKDKSPGTFVVRDSNSFPGAFGLAVKVAQVPPNVQTKSGDPQAELVRHFLIEPTSKGVKLKGCSNEPVFGSLAALVYQHSITPLALPCKLLLQEDSSTSGWDDVDGFSSQILQQGAACSVIYLNSIDTESLTGPEAVSKAVKETLAMKPPPKTTIVHFKVASQGITLTDNKRKLFFRRHYPISTVTFCGMDADDRHWTQVNADTGMPMNARCFGFVARKQGSATDNACHIFAEVEPEQPASAIVNFVTKVLIGQSPK